MPDDDQDEIPGTLDGTTPHYSMSYFPRQGMVVAKRSGIDPDDQEFRNALHQRIAERVHVAINKQSYTVRDKHGAEMIGPNPLERLVAELIAEIEQARGPSLEEQMAAKRAGGAYII
jgi:hypothetical protein